CICSCLFVFYDPATTEIYTLSLHDALPICLGLETIQDNVGNVIIRKPATSGMENRKTVVLQSHLDMVHQKNNDTEFDFDSEGIRDRKSTRLNSSHVKISYAVFCLKKKKKNK